MKKIKYAKKIKVKLISIFNYDYYTIQDLEDYLREVYKSRGIVHEVKLFDKNVIAIIKGIEPPDAYAVDSNTKIEILNTRKPLNYIF